MEQKKVEKRFYTEQELAQIIPKSAKSLANDRWRRKGLPYTTIGTKILYDYDDVVKYLEVTKKPALFFDTWRLHDPQKILKIDGIKYSNLGFDNFSS